MGWSGSSCAQLGTDLTKSDGQNFNPLLTEVADKIEQIRPSTDGDRFGWSWRSQNRPKPCKLTMKSAKFR